MNKKAFLLSLLWCFCLLDAIAQRTVLGHVIDAETKESMPYVSIYLGPNRGTITNNDGDFLIEVLDDDEAIISFVGYEKQKIKASSLGGTIKLKPFKKELREVVVQAIEPDFLKDIIKQLKKDYKANWKEKQTYFYRLLLENDDDNYLMELFMNACSAVNLRDLTVVSGTKGVDLQGKESNISLYSSNIHHQAEIAPVTYNSTFWENAIKPLTSYRTMKKRYLTSVEVLKGDNNEQIYKVNFKLDPRYIPRDDWTRYITGTLSVDASTKHLLSFDGVVNNAFQNVDFNRLPCDIKFHIDYNYNKGFPAVTDITVNGGNEKMKYRTMLFALPGKKLYDDDKFAVGSNLLEGIAAAGYDSTLWDRYDIVKRTEEEEAIASGVTSPIVRTPRQQRFTPDTIPTNNKRLSDLYQHLNNFGYKTPQEKVYVQMDNNCYFQGDTIWFSAYTRNTATGTPSHISELLYVELYTPDGFLMERQFIRMRNGKGHGNFVLERNPMYSGFYELRAYTRWQLNWGLFEHPHNKESMLSFNKDYYRDYDKIYSRVFPVYDKPKEPGDYSRDMTMRPMRRYFKNDPDKADPKIDFYPEGGHLIEGVPCQVAFEAHWDNGEAMDGTLMVNDSVVTTVNRGRGRFTLIPQPNMDRKLTFTDKDGTTVSERLPKAEKQGVALQVSNNEGLWKIDVFTSAGISPDSLGLTIMHEGLQQVFRPIQSAQSHFSFAEEKLMAGVNQVTVYDVNGQILADRLFFVQHKDMQQPTLTISGVKDTYNPLEQIQLSIIKNEMNDSTVNRKKDVPDVVAVSVRSAYDSDNTFDTGNIFTEMLLSSEIKGFVPDPGWFFEQDDEEHRTALDLLMMTQGWRRFSWHDMAVPGAWQQIQPNEKTQILDAYVKQYTIEEEVLNIPNTNDFQPILNDHQNDRFPQQGNDNHGNPADNDKEEDKNYEEWAHEPREDEVTTRQTTIYKKPKDDLYMSCIAMRTDVAPPIIHKGFLKVNDGACRIEYSGLKGMGILMLDVAKVENPDSTTVEIAPNYCIQIDYPYPRFVKPYSFYQEHLQSSPKMETLAPTLLADGTHQLREVPVTAKHNGLRRFNDGIPALILGNVEAENIIFDSGLSAGRPVDGKTLVHALFDDMGNKYPYVHDFDEDGNCYRSDRIAVRWGLSPTRRIMEGLDDVPLDSTYAPKYLKSYNPRKFPFSPGEKDEILQAHKEDGWIENYVIYTDYCPRLEGYNRYQASDLPERIVVECPYRNGNRYPMEAQRCIPLPGYSIADEFYHPNYSKHQMPAQPDYRRTLYWNPNLQLDENGEAQVMFYNNSRTTQLSVEAEGQASDGTLLWGKEG